MIKRKSLFFTYFKILIVIALIVVIILIAIKFINRQYNNQEFENIKTNMLLIKGKTEIISQKVEIKEKDIKYIGTKLKDKEVDDIIQNLIDNEIIDLESKKSNYYCLDNSNLEELGLENVKTDDYYIVDYEKNDVIYINGIKDNNGNIIYKLSDMK